MPGLPVLVLSQYVEERYAVELLAGGASGVGYLLKERVADVAEFVDAVHRVADGGTSIDHEVITQLMARGQEEPGRLADPARTRGARPDGTGTVQHGASRRRSSCPTARWRSTSGNIFAKLGLEPSNSEHRRVRAVLTYLNQA